MLWQTFVIHGYMQYGLYRHFVHFFKHKKKMTLEYFIKTAQNNISRWMTLFRNNFHHWFNLPLRQDHIASQH